MIRAARHRLRKRTTDITAIAHHDDDVQQGNTLHLRVRPQAHLIEPSDSTVRQGQGHVQTAPLPENRERYGAEKPQGLRALQAREGARGR